MIASLAGYIENIRLLKKAKAKIDLQDAVGNTALINAARSNNLAVVRLLLEYGANKLIPNNDGLLAFDFTKSDDDSEQEKKELRQLLQIDVDDIFSNPQTKKLSLAAEQGDISRIQELLENGVIVNASGINGITPLLWALGKENFDSFVFLLKSGADPNKKGINLVSAVYLASLHQDSQFLEAAIVNGGQVEHKGPRGVNYTYDCYPCWPHRERSYYS